MPNLVLDIQAQANLNQRWTHQNINQKPLKNNLKQPKNQESF